MIKVKSIGNSKLIVVGVSLVAMITAGVLLIRPAQIRASWEDKPQLLLEADVEGGTYLIGQTITLTATLDRGDVIGDVEYDPGQSFQAQGPSYICYGRAWVSWNPKGWVVSNPVELEVKEFNKPTVHVRLNIDDYDNVNPWQEIVIGYDVTGAWPSGGYEAEYIPEESFKLMHKESEICYVKLKFTDDLGYEHEIESEDQIEVTANPDAVQYFNVQFSADPGGSVDFVNGYYPEGSIINALAVPDEHYKFGGWRGKDAFPALRRQEVDGNIEDTAIFYVDPNNPPPEEDEE